MVLLDLIWDCKFSLVCIVYVARVTCTYMCIRIQNAVLKLRLDKC